jgi:hypothetical protein
MNYVKELEALEYESVFEKMHRDDWEQSNVIDEDFCLTKRQQFFEAIDDVEQYDLIYFDAFGYRVQPDLWSTAIFQKCILRSKTMEYW